MIYFDTGIIIRLVEGVDRVRIPIEERLQAIRDADRVAITSRLSRLECRCKPIREKRTDLLESYDVFFSSEDVVLQEIDAAVIEKATELRASFGLKIPDAIHVATALLCKVAAFWTVDQRLARFSWLPVEVFAAV
jgi:predicted nucleic acid-binding protein